MVLTLRVTLTYHSPSLAIIIIIINMPLVEEISPCYTGRRRRIPLTLGADGKYKPTHLEKKGNI